MNVGFIAVQAGGPSVAAHSVTLWTPAHLLLDCVVSVNMERELTSSSLFPGLDMWALSHLPGLADTQEGLGTVCK